MRGFGRSETMRGRAQISPLLCERRARSCFMADMLSNRFIIRPEAGGSGCGMRGSCWHCAPPALVIEANHLSSRCCINDWEEFDSSPGELSFRIPPCFHETKAVCDFIVV